MPNLIKEEAEYLRKLISQGEHQQLDFKFLINDSVKIARSLVAFANTDGGTLLVGVKDNGKIAGVRSEEEIYMIDAAATLYCRPEIQYKLRLWEPEKDKQVLEVIIRSDQSKLWKARADDGHWKVWLRCRDQNILAGNVWELVWKKKHKMAKESIVFDKYEHLVFSHLLPEKKYQIHDISGLTSIKLSLLEQMISDFVVLGLMDMFIEDQNIYFTVKKNPEV